MVRLTLDGRYIDDFPLSIAEQRHKPEVHVQLLMTVKERQSRIVGDEVECQILVAGQCLPPNGYRLDDFVQISVSVDYKSRLSVTWADFRNGQPNCRGPAATATPPCDNDVFYSFSVNHGATWSSATKLTPPGSAQWMPWSGVTSDGSTLWVAYYDRSYGNCEQTGCNDITLAKVVHPTSNAPTIGRSRVTTRA
jgi:hypothetical protein